LRRFLKGGKVLNLKEGLQRIHTVYEFRSFDKKEGTISSCSMGAYERRGTIAWKKKVRILPSGGVEVIPFSYRVNEEEKEKRQAMMCSRRSTNCDKGNCRSRKREREKEVHRSPGREIVRSGKKFEFFGVEAEVQRLDGSSGTKREKGTLRYLMRGRG